MSGITRGGQLRFLTLTSTPDSPKNIENSWRALYMRMKRRGLIQGYIKVPELTKSGLLHYHILFRGKFIAQKLISLWWSQIHGARVVDIRYVKVSRQPTRVAGYMAKYMSKESAGRYSWSWGWVWKGFCNDWRIYKRFWWAYIYREGVNSFEDCLAGWNAWLKGMWRPVREEMLDLLAEPGNSPETTLIEVTRACERWVQAIIIPIGDILKAANLRFQSLRPGQLILKTVNLPASG